MRRAGAIPSGRGLARGAAYGVAQTARAAWYTAQYLGARRIAGPATPPGEVPKPYRGPMPREDAVRRAYLALMAAEARDIARGVYRLPKDYRTPHNPLRLLEQARQYFRESAEITRRSHRKGGATEVRDLDGYNEYPTYYLQNFHFQSGGWLTDGSADIYDTQVEALFTGAADAMRRRALPFIRVELERAGKEDLTVADVGCGTGRLLRDVVDNFPNLAVTALDLSGPYLERARTAVGKQADNVTFQKGAAEALPFEDQSIDLLYSVYLFHELPPKVRKEVASEFARVLKPGGLYLHVDSVQYGDTALDLLLEGFPRVVHEPYYDGYAKEALSKLFTPDVFTAEGEDIGFLTKVSGFRRASVA